ncbi:MAG: alpha/beta fold hydrolase [Bryobacterales bacterium]|nr:alpha/beta fold hydrolase [Bryobacterales bacterium]
MWLWAAAAMAVALFDYDRGVPLEYRSEPFPQKVEDVRVSGASLRGVDGGRVNMVVMAPLTARARRPAVIYQHGGGQTMLTYFPEAVAMARAGAIAVIPDPPAAVEGRTGDMRRMDAGQVRDWYVRVLVAERRVLDWLASRGDVDMTRVAYVGHSYGGMTGAMLAAVEPRIKAYVLIGPAGSAARHVAESPSAFWREWRAARSAEQLATDREVIAAVDPLRYAGEGKSRPKLVQCERWEVDPSLDCEGLAKAMGAEVRLYETDHAFADYRAGLDRMAFVGRQLGLRVKP